MLYPITTETRRVDSLDGIWRFRFDPVQGREASGTNDRFPEHGLTDTVSMPVPSAWNDVFEDQTDREFVGWVWYERDFLVPDGNPEESTILRFGSATHHAIVWVNGVRVAEHRGGFTPFEVTLDDVVRPGTNRLTVAVSNILDYSTLPIGNYEEREVPGVGTVYSNRPNFDFYNYAGLQRSVVLYTVPKHRFTDITIVADYEGTEGAVSWEVSTAEAGGAEGADTDAVSAARTVSIEVLDEAGTVCAVAEGRAGTVRIPNVQLWQPPDAYLYTLKVTLSTEDGGVSDVYYEQFGVRRVLVQNGRFYINDRPFYFKGFGKHEHAPLRGRGVDEVPAVGLMIGFDFDVGNMMGKGGEKPDTWKTLTCAPAHRQVVQEMIARDKNHPSVVMWSVGNEPDSGKAGAGAYFAPIFDLARSLDPTERPVTCVLIQHGDITKDEVAPLCDVIAINRYYGWYFAHTNLEVAKAGLTQELTNWGELFPDTPILFTEYGADTVAGLHDTGSVMFTEEYQTQYYQANHEVFDRFPRVIGEQPWNFADFATARSVLRVQGNKKGLFTRERQPKQAVFALKARWGGIPHFDYKSEENE